jgi:hypothetical protein
MSVEWVEVTDIPSASGIRARRSLSYDIANVVLKSDTGKFEVTADNPVELQRFYRTFVQWKSRHSEVPVAIRKDGERVYLWREEPVPGKGPRANVRVIPDPDRLRVRQSAEKASYASEARVEENRDSKNYTS